MTPPQANPSLSPHHCQHGFDRIGAHWCGADSSLRAALGGRSIIFAFSAVFDGSTATLEVGIGRKCNIMTSVDCPLDKLAEMRVDGKIVASIDAGSMSPKQLMAMKQALLGALPPEYRPEYRPLSPLLRFDL